MIETRQALVFDYDGVIADTEPLHWKVVGNSAIAKRHSTRMGRVLPCRTGSERPANLRAFPCTHAPIWMQMRSQF